MKKIKVILIKWLFRDIIVSNGIQFSNNSLTGCENIQFVVKTDVLILGASELKNCELTIKLKA